MTGSVKDEVSRIVGEVMGYASVCWQPRPEGVFDSSLATQGVNHAIDALFENFSITRKES